MAEALKALIFGPSRVLSTGEPEGGIVSRLVETLLPGETLINLTPIEFP
jgi:hypothetical protein